MELRFEGLAAPMTAACLAGTLLGFSFHLAATLWRADERCGPELGHEVIAQIKDLLAENAQLRLLASQADVATSSQPSASCPSEPLPPDGRVSVDHTDGDAGLPRAMVAGITTAFFAPLIYTLVREWALFQELRNAAPELANIGAFVRYRLDLWVSTQAGWQEISLCTISTAIVLLGGWVYHFASGNAVGSSIHKVWIFLIDTGAHGDLDDAVAWCVAWVITICGMVVFALLISILTERLQQFLEAMRRGHSRVLCSGHVLILGWSDKIPTIIEELAEANSSEGGGTVVILAPDKQKTEMEEEIQYQLENSQSIYRGLGLRGTRWVVRSGNPMLIADLKMVSVELAKSIIILVDNSLPPAQADEKTLRTLLGLAGLDSEACKELEAASDPASPARSPRRPVEVTKQDSKDMDKVSESEVGALVSRASGESLGPPPLLSLSKTRQRIPLLSPRLEEPQSPGTDVAPSPSPQSMGSPSDLSVQTRPAPAAEAPEKHRPHIVVELTDIDSVPLVQALGSSKTEIIVGHDMAGQLLIQGSREEGLSRVYETIVGFSGPEFYIEEWPCLEGLTFGEVAFCFAAAIPCGLVCPDGLVQMNPQSGARVQKGDKVVVIAEDNDTYEASKDGPLYKYTGHHLTTRKDELRFPEHILICGWRRDLGDMISDLEAVVEPGSSLTLMSLVDKDSRLKRLGENCREEHLNLKNLTLIHCEGDPCARPDLEKLPLETYDSVIVVADEELESNANAMAADGHAIATMLLVLDIRRSRPSAAGKDPLRVTSELRDTRTRNLIQATGLSDYVMSQNIIASTIANVAESREVNAIIREILTSRGNSIYLRSSHLYLQSSMEQVSFWELCARARDREEVLLGYRAGCDGTIVINPDGRDEERQWQDATMIVLARDARPGRGADMTGASPRNAFCFNQPRPSIDNLSTPACS